MRPAENCGDSHTRAAPEQEHGAEQRRSRGGDDAAVVLVGVGANIVMFWFVCGCSDYLQSAAAQCSDGQLRH